MQELHKKHSKFLSLILRHSPDVLNLDIDTNGWVSIKELIANSSNQKYKFDNKNLHEIVSTDNKGRYEINDDNTKIRARQGHSISTVTMDFIEKEPPNFLYHGTSVENYKKIIKSQKIISMSRNKVHLSSNKETASQVGNRHGELKIILIDSKKMFDDGIKFQLSNNNVWLTDEVPTKYFVHNEES